MEPKMMKFTLTPRDRLRKIRDIIDIVEQRCLCARNAAMATSRCLQLSGLTSRLRTLPGSSSLQVENIRFEAGLGQTLGYGLKFLPWTPQDV